MRLVAGLMARFSADAGLLVTIVAEPRGWQSLKLSRREAQIPRIVRHWERLGFCPHVGGYSCQAAVVARHARAYEMPTDLAAWGRSFERAWVSETEQGGGTVGP